MDPKPPSRWRRVLDSPAAPSILLLISAGLIVWTIRRFSIWIDESATLLLVGPHSVGQIVDFTRFDAHPPLWYLILKPWLELFGTNVIASRAQSALFMLGAFAVWYRFLKLRFSRAVALLALALMVTNPMLLHYAIEGRMYAFAILLVSLSCLLITGSWKRRWIAYWFCAVAMLWTHYFLAFVLLAQFGYLLLARKEHGRSVLWLVIYGASIVATFVPWLPYAFQMTHMAVSNGFWIAPLTPNTAIAYVLMTFLHRLDGELVGWSLFPAVIFTVTWFASMIRAGRARGGPNALLWLIVAIPPLLLFMLSCWPFVPIFHPRYVIFGIPALISLVAIGALSFSGRWRIAAIAILVVGQLSGIKMLRWKGFNDTRGYWAASAVIRDVRKPIDGELPMVISSWLFTFFDVRVSLTEKHRVVHFRETPPADNSIPDVMYSTHPDWYISSLDDVHAKHVWFLDELMHTETKVPDSWELVLVHYRGYARERLYRIPQPGEPPKLSTNPSTIPPAP